MSQQNEIDTVGEEREVLWGWPIKRWAAIITIVSISAFVIFLAIPFLLSIIAPFCGENSEQFGALVDTLDGVALVLGLTGTLASVVSIFMTVQDQKRFRNEKEQTAVLLNSVNKLHEELSIVDSYVKKTFETNQKLSAQLYEANIINKPKAETDIGVSINTDGADWSNIKNANEIPLSEETA